MAKLVFGLNQSLDGYVDHAQMPPDPAVFRHFVEQVRGVSGVVYGRRMYEVMRYWERLSGLRNNKISRRRGRADQSGSRLVR